MIYTYGVSLQGESHKRSNILCQDAHKVEVCDNGICIAAIADGLGSEKYSDIASKIAVDVVVQFCREHLVDINDEEQVIDIIKLSFFESLRKIESRALLDGRDINQYDTTLSACILYSGKLFYGHSGDGGIVVLAEDGLFYNITKQQRDDEARVFPLCFGEEKWVFGKFEKMVASVLLATDGIYELFFPIYIKNETINIYTALAKYFMYPDILNITNEDMYKIKKSRLQYIERIGEMVVDDDKTLVVAIDSAIKVTKQNDDYYKEPDWERLKKKYRESYNKKAYSDL